MDQVATPTAADLIPDDRAVRVSQDNEAGYGLDSWRLGCATDPVAAYSDLAAGLLAARAHCPTWCQWHPGQRSGQQRARVA